MGYSQVSVDEPAKSVPKSELKSGPKSRPKSGPFPQTTNVKRHVESVHERIKSHKCEFCGAAFAHKSHWLRHLKHDHKDRNIKNEVDTEISYSEVAVVEPEISFSEVSVI